jgi:hypothetical protein
MNDDLSGQEIVLQPGTAADVGGRPSKYEPRYCDEVIEHMTDGGTLTSFAAKIRVSRTTITTWQETHPAFHEAASIGKACCTAWYEERLRRAADGQGGTGATPAAIFALKNLSPEDWQDRQQHEIIARARHEQLSPEQAIEEATKRGLPTRYFEE